MQKKYCVSFCPIDIIPEEYQTVCDVFSKKGLLPDKWDYVENVENKASVDSLPRTLIVIVGKGSINQADQLEKILKASSSKNHLIFFIHHQNDFPEILSAGKHSSDVYIWDDSKQLEEKLVECIEKELRVIPLALSSISAPEPMSNFEDSWLSHLRSVLEHKIETEDNSSNFYAIELMLYAHQKLNDYYSGLSSRMKEMKKTAVITFYSGIILLLLNAFFLKITGVNPILSFWAICIIIIESISLAAFLSYKKASAQFNEYRHFLHNIERFYSLIHIAGEASSSKDTLYTQIINSELKQIKYLNHKSKKHRRRFLQK